MHLFNFRNYLSLLLISFFANVCPANDSATLSLFEFKKDAPQEIDRPILPFFEIKKRSRRDYENYLDSLGPWQERCADTEGSSTACVADRASPEELERWEKEEKESNRQKEEQRAEVCKNVKWNELNLDQRRNMQIICGLKPDGSADDMAEVLRQAEVMLKRFMERSKARKDSVASPDELLRHAIPAVFHNSFSTHEAAIGP